MLERGGFRPIRICEFRFSTLQSMCLPTYYAGKLARTVLRGCVSERKRGYDIAPPLGLWSGPLSTARYSGKLPDIRNSLAIHERLKAAIVGTIPLCSPVG